MMPLTEHMPKHLLNVGGVPFIEHQLRKLAAVGIEHVVLATSYKAELFRPVLGDGERFGLVLTYVTEDEPLGTAGAIRNAAQALPDDPEAPVVVLNGDILSGHDLTAQIRAFESGCAERQIDVSLHLVTVEDARPFGCVPTDDSGRVLGFVEKSDTPVTNQINAGCYVFRRRVIDTIPSGRAVSVERETFPQLLEQDATVVGYIEPTYWRDIGNPAALVAASRDIVLGIAPSSIGFDPSGARIHPTARVEGKVAGGSVVAAGAVVEAGAVVMGSVVMENAIVTAGTVLTDSYIAPGSGASLAG